MLMVRSVVDLCSQESTTRPLLWNEPRRFVLTSPSSSVLNRRNPTTTTSRSSRQDQRSSLILNQYRHL